MKIKIYDSNSNQSFDLAFPNNDKNNCHIITLWANNLTILHNATNNLVRIFLGL